MEHKSPTPRQAKWIRASLYIIPVLILIGAVYFVFRQHTMLDLALAALIVSAAVVIAWYVRKFETTQTMRKPKKDDYVLAFGMLAIIVLFDLFTSFEWHDGIHRTVGLAAKLAFGIPLLPFVLFYRSPSTYQQIQKLLAPTEPEDPLPTAPSPDTMSSE